jgi:imidazolonepropionase-like amidohydrolase
MEPRSWLIDGVGLDDGEPLELAIGNGVFVDRVGAFGTRLPGRFVLAGLVDAHVHLAMDFSGANRGPGDPDLVAENLRAQLHAGVIVARDVGAPVGVRVGGDHDDGPFVLAAGRFLAPDHGYLDGLYAAVEPADLIEAALAELRATGSGWVKLVFDFPEHFTGPPSFLDARPNYPPELMRGLCDAVHVAGGRVAAHVSGPGDASLAVAVGVDSLEHGHDVPIDDLVALGARGGAWTPTLGTVWRDALAHSPMAATFEAHYRDALAVACSAGVTVLAGTDANPHGSIADEIALLASLGMTPTQAIAAASSEARAYLARPGLIVGQPADVVTYHDDPRNDIDVLRHPAAIIRDGHRIR